MLAVTGRNTTIVAELARLLPGEDIVRINADLSDPHTPLDLPTAPRYVLAAGLLYNKKPIEQQTDSEILASLSVNCINAIRIVERVFAAQHDARICVIGSESAFKGCFDETYFLGKAALHSYVKARRTSLNQQLVCVSPDVISDSGMTRRRHDYPGVLTTRPMVTAREVAEVIKRALYDNPPDYATGCILRVTPQKH